MRRTGISHLDLFVGNGVLPVCRTSVDSVDMVDAAANSILLDNPDTHPDGIDLKLCRKAIKSLLVDNGLKSATEL